MQKAYCSNEKPHDLWTGNSYYFGTFMTAIEEAIIVGKYLGELEVLIL